MDGPLSRRMVVKSHFQPTFRAQMEVLTNRPSAWFRSRTGKRGPLHPDKLDCRGSMDTRWQSSRFRDGQARHRPGPLARQRARRRVDRTFALERRNCFSILG